MQRPTSSYHSSLFFALWYFAGLLLVSSFSKLDFLASLALVPEQKISILTPTDSPTFGESSVTVNENENVGVVRVKDKTPDAQHEVGEVRLTT